MPDYSIDVTFEGSPVRSRFSLVNYPPVLDLDSLPHFFLSVKTITGQSKTLQLTFTIVTAGYTFVADDQGNVQLAFVDAATGEPANGPPSGIEASALAASDRRSCDLTYVAGSTDWSITMAELTVQGPNESRLRIDPTIINKGPGGPLAP